MRILELFAGYGSQALALENLGIEFTSDIAEIDKYAVEAYNQLHGNTHNWGDITKINEKELPYYDLITYSSPCQDFSVAGLGKGGDKDSGTRSSLLWECERIIRAVKPKYLLMENVKNLVGEKHKHNFVKWLRVLESLGYQNYWKVLNAKDYGVPQNRERVFVVSIRKDIQQSYIFPEKQELKIRLKDVLENNVNEKYYLSERMIDGFLKHNNNHLGKTGFVWKLRSLDGYASALRANSALAPTDNTIAEPICIGGMQKHQAVTTNGVSTCLCSAMGTGVGLEPKIIEYRFFEQAIKTAIEKGVKNGDTIDAFNQRVNDTGICPTLTTRPEGFKTAILPVQDYRIRKLTPRECWRLMGVKDEQFDKLHDLSNTQLYKMAGNSIVVDVLMGIFKNLLITDKQTTGQLTLL